MHSGVIRLLPSAVLVSTCFLRRFCTRPQHIIIIIITRSKHTANTWCSSHQDPQRPTFLMSSRDSPFITLFSLGAEDSGPAAPGPELFWAEFCRSCWYLSISGFSMMVVES